MISLHLFALAVSVFGSMAEGAAPLQEGTSRNKRGVVMGVLVSPPSVCVLEGESATLGCTPEGGDNVTCSWGSDRGMAFTKLSDIRLGRLKGVSVSADTPCGITLSDVSAATHHAATFTCRAASGPNEAKEAALMIHVVQLPVIVPPGSPSDKMEGRDVVTDGTNTGDVTVSTSRPTRVPCHAALDDIMLMWWLGGKNVSGNATLTRQTDGVTSDLVWQFELSDRQKSLRCCYELCGKEFCASANLKTLYKARQFSTRHPSSGGLEVRLKSSPPPKDLTFALTDSCKDERPVLLDTDHDNITLAVRNESSTAFMVHLLIHDANSTVLKKNVVLSVTQEEGTATYCTPYARRGMGTGAIIGISVGVVAAVTLLSLALFIYHKSRSENYSA